MSRTPHQYIERHSGRVCEERLFADRLIGCVYNGLREKSQRAFKALTSARASEALGYLNYDTVLGSRLKSGPAMLRALGVDPAECLDDPKGLDTARKVFERRIRYWRCRPMPEDPAAIVSPSDARILLGSLQRESMLFLKDKFFDFRELLGEGKTRWLRAFADGDWAVLRLTPDKYHYNHTPVAGRVIDCYGLEGDHHSCNPRAVVRMVTPFSKNRRLISVIDTDQPGGTGCGLVAMVEVVALMVGDIVDCYSARRYDDPQPLTPGLFVEKGAPKSLFRPGSSTVVLLFQAGRARFAADLLAAQRRLDVSSRFSLGFGAPLAEVDVAVRSAIATAIAPNGAGKFGENR
ncbi:Phosphatidylserine decarboxylase [Desulfarculus baarsii DSM 2075]|uniref:Phosphatidylserine decarboxylase n=1 Tax=Desulfarculus baarsii (strain ATCC 33931 / DSM 2075 / LMG 7858 / VKM B-1802 / 2st14) TaxID=644282 RepID=E1QEK5_DESB2|nr:phosphatidylserine decarboxylase [Desulfarculus baarsii]ADK83991.1 Phosphatidylserine decarboxylase [Desulfarculus baarsii DSM 2075]